MYCNKCGSQNDDQSQFCQSCGTPLQPVSDLYHPGPPQVEYAGFWRRFLAALIDGIIVGIVNGIISFILSEHQYLYLIIATLINWLYFALMESSGSQGTLGKMAIGIKVTDLDGKPISFARATGRNFAKFISAMIFMIGYIMAAFTNKKQALHDIIAGCLVVKKS